MKSARPCYGSSVSTLLAVDPGLNAPACALFRSGTLVIAEPVKIPRALSKLDLIDRCRQVAQLIMQWYVAKVAQQWATGTQSPLHLVVERPQIYRGSKSKGDPNDLPPMVGIDAALAAYLDCPVTSYLPREWVGGTSKAETGDPWKSPRGHRVWGRLTEAERAVVVPTHDVIDAVGIGLCYLKRFDPVRVYPGAT